MAFVLAKKEDMQNIYEMAKKVYDRQISADEAAALLAKETEARTSSLKMYFNIYASMRKGKCYKLGTSAAFTEFLLEQIYLDFGEAALIIALQAAKLHAEYRISVNNEQPGIEAVCRKIIKEKNIDIQYDSLPSYQTKGETKMISERERNNLLDAINKPNAEFASTLMQLVEKYQKFSDEDLELLCDRYKSREIFFCDYSYLKQIELEHSFDAQLKSADGRNRYYRDTYVLNGRTFVVTSQLYGYGGVSSHRDNRTPFYNWVVSKFDVKDGTDDWWPTKEDYDLQLTKEDWRKYILEVELPHHPSPMRMLKGMMELGGEASCKQLSELYGGHPSVYAGCAMNLGRRVKKHFNLPPCMDGKQERYFPFPFLGKYRGGSEDNYIYRIRPELLAALNEIDLSSIDPHYQEEHKTGHFDSWEIVDENTAIKTCDKSFFAYNGSGVPKEICWFFDAENIPTGTNKAVKLIFNGQEYAGKLSNDTTDRRRIQIRWSGDLAKGLEEYQKNNAKAVFVKQEEGVYEITMKGGEENMTVKTQVAKINEYISAKGFNYDGQLIENFYLSLKAKPFVILAGTSGTGKTRLVRLFAEAIQAQYKLVSVRPDWSDSSDLFGHVDLNQKFIPGAIIDFVKQAELNPTKPYFLCLDEMNLARVEYYMSDILSAIETRRYESGRIVTDPVIPSSNYGNDSSAAGRYGKVVLPGNLYIVGTVNMDETTFPFSKKVLDRANTIEFSYVDLLSMPTFSMQSAEQISVQNDFLVSKYITLNDCDAKDAEYISSVCTSLQRINSVLEKANAHVGYRVRDEIVFYMLNNRESGLLEETVALDNQIMQKILPRIQGSSEAIKAMLEELLKVCASEKYTASEKKINFMIKRYEEDGFTSYWL